MSDIKSSTVGSGLNLAADTYQRWRLFKDRLTHYAVVTGGLAVIVAIGLIFFYLLYVVIPLFQSATGKAVSHYPLPAANLGKTLLLSVEEQNEVAVRFTDLGDVVFFDAKSGKMILTETVAIPDGATITSFAAGSPASGVVVYGLSDGRAVIVKHRYQIAYPNNVRHITPTLEYPLGNQPVVIDNSGLALHKVAAKVSEDMTTIVVKTADNRILLTHFQKQESLFDDEATLQRTDSLIDLPASDINYMLLDDEQRHLYLADQSGRLSLIDVANKAKPIIAQHLNVVPAGRQITSLAFLNGNISLLVGDSSGVIAQWSLVRDQQNHLVLQQLRQFEVADSPVGIIAMEQRRKGFVAADRQGLVAVFHSTAERKLIAMQVSRSAPVALALAPRADAFLLQDASGKIHFWRVYNEHPEVSLKSLWQAVWYESYSGPDYIWQSSSASNDFEPKFSLTPLVFGTLKAAFYAMLVAIPVAIMGAIYTAYFMTPAMRRLVKPSIEIMEALPTVILGFLAGLWLAPYVEENLAAIMLMLLVIPVGVLLFAFGWHLLPEKYSGKITDGWQAALLIPVVLLSGWLAFIISGPVQTMFFNGDLRFWLSSVLGIDYDQRNALIVGLAMGFAVIPTIFSITEDAIFSVPKHLTVGSLALGATPWQTMMRVVLLTASPGIFSAVMIGVGRAVGETMIVLMATGNTPVMDMSIFQGMRTLSANIAVEMPESEVDSTHYRVLFLAALVLFLFTFVFNTLAELIRQRLREKYSSL